ncbi:MAG: hypothetical protein HGA31_05635 [Candidatus Moranbacteria bacterium]|nr:hypothetical protein [Candidatus Moranbacteria bacterium]
MHERYDSPKIASPEPKPAESVAVEHREQERQRDDEFIAIRHSIAEYKLNNGIVTSEHPEDAPDSNKQEFDTDLTEAGRELAKKEAETFFDTLNPETDALFFTSSDLVRAAETAKIYLEVALERGFEILSPFDESMKPEAYRNKAEEIGEGNIRRINALTLDHLSNMLREFVFHPDDYLATMVRHPENVSQETLDKWPAARAIITSANKQGWGPNYAEHSEEIANIFPDVKSAEEVHRLKFLRLLKLMLVGERKIRAANPDKNVKVLGFTHENSFLRFLNRDFGESMKNCEAVRFRVTDDPDAGEGAKKITATAKGKTVEVRDRYESGNES